MAQLVIRLPFTPVPITGQTFAVLLCAAALGSRRGAIAQLAYLGLGSAGVPVFAGWSGGAAAVHGPTAGYLLGFVVAAYAVGALVERGWDRRLRTAWAPMLVGSLIIYGCGISWLALVMRTSLTETLLLGIYPFVPGDLLKIALAAGLLPSAWSLVGRRRGESRSE
jgi:biotin transport system substrate-specific component